MTVQFPPEDLIRRHPEIFQFKHTVEDAMKYFPLLVPTSWWRDYYYNLSTEDAQPLSQHILGLAIDLDWPGGTLEDFKRVGGAFLTRGLSSFIYYTPTKHYIHTQALPFPIGRIDPSTEMMLTEQFNIFAPTGHVLLWDLVWDVITRRDRSPKPQVRVIGKGYQWDYFLEDLEKLVEVAGIKKVIGPLPGPT